MKACQTLCNIPDPKPKPEPNQNKTKPSGFLWVCLFQDVCMYAKGMEYRLSFCIRHCVFCTLQP